MKVPAATVVFFLAHHAALLTVNAFAPPSGHTSTVRVVRSTTTSGLTLATGATAASATGRNTSLMLFSSSSSNNFLGMDDDDDEEDEDEDDDDEDLALSSSRYSSAKSPFTGMKLDPFDPNPLIKPRPSRYFKESLTEEVTVPDDQLKQNMSESERKENLTVMRQIQKSDLPDLRRRKDHAGWVEANNDLKRRYAKDPWFGVNERLRNAVQLGDPQDKIDYLTELANKLGGPPPGITLDETKGYAV